MQGIQDINDVYGNLACVTDCTRFAVPACFHPGAVCVKAIDGTISQSGFDEMEKEPHKYFFRRCYLGFETGSSICCSASCVQDAIKDAQSMIDANDGIYHYVNVYEDGKFIGRCTKDGFVSAR